MTKALEKAISAELGFDSEVFLRTREEIATLAALEPFSDEQLAGSKGKPQVGFYASAPTAKQHQQVLALAPEGEPVVLEGHELHWLPAAGISDSKFDPKAIEKIIGPCTIRTRNTIVRLEKKFFS